MNRPAFLTGSRAYGTPTETSDVDLVVLLRDGNTLSQLAALADNVAEAMSTPSALADSSASLLFGRLNLVVLKNEAEYDAWLAATDALAARRPVTRDEAKSVIQATVAGAALPTSPASDDDSVFP